MCLFSFFISKSKPCTHLDAVMLQLIGGGALRDEREITRIASRTSSAAWIDVASNEAACVSTLSCFVSIAAFNVRKTDLYLEVALVSCAR